MVNARLLARQGTLTVRYIDRVLHAPGCGSTINCTRLLTVASRCYGRAGRAVFVSALASAQVGIGRFYFGILRLWEIGTPALLLLLFLIAYCVDYKTISKTEFRKYVRQTLASFLFFSDSDFNYFTTCYSYVCVYFFFHILTSH